MATLARLRTWARLVKRDAHALHLAARDPRVRWVAKIVAGLVAAYAFSPLDLIPDFVPVLGYLNDLVLVPLGILLAIALIPRDVMAEHCAAADAADGRPVRRGAAVGIATLWILSIGFVGWLLWHRGGL